MNGKFSHACMHDVYSGEPSALLHYPQTADQSFDTCNTGTSQLIERMNHSLLAILLALPLFVSVCRLFLKRALPKRYGASILSYSRLTIITVNGDWKLEFFTAAIPDPEMLAEDFAICSNISNYNSTLPSENECMLSVLLCLAYNPFSPKKLLKEPYRCSFGEIVIPIKISLIKTDGVVIHRLSSENAIKSEFSTKLPVRVS
ncbi:hypothetical protein D917_08215, partial [Trichinella nativa]